MVFNEGISLKKSGVVLNALASSRFLFISFSAIIAIAAFGFLNGVYIKNTSAESASSGNSVYSASIANNSNVAIDIIPTATQQVFSSTDNITFSNTCPAGANVTIQTSSDSNKLTRISADSLPRDINPTIGTSLVDNSWGFSVDGGLTYQPVPVNGDETNLYTSTSAESNKVIPVTFGVKVDNNLISGAYVNNIVYTVTVKPECLSYTLKFDLNGGTGATGMDYSDKTMVYGDEINLAQYAPTKSGMIFNGWTSGSNTFTGNETSVNPNPNNEYVITLTANYISPCLSGIAQDLVDLSVNDTKSFAYTGAAKCATFVKGGYYKFEAWGASGGYGGKAAYTSGVLEVGAGQSMYVYVGQQGAINNASAVFNGGGVISSWSSEAGTFGGGGGATDFRTVGGSWNNSESLSSRIMVAAGSGGGLYWSYYGNSVSYGANAGGLTGYNGAIITARGHSATSVGSIAYGGSQVSGGAGGAGGMYSNGGSGSFGSGGNQAGYRNGAGAGGSGWYGGGCGGEGGYSTATGGGGSSYISGHAGSIGSTSAANTAAKCSSGSSTIECSSSWTGYVFTNTLMIDGAGYQWNASKGSLAAMPNPAGGNYGSGVGHSGNGAARVTYLGTSI